MTLRRALIVCLFGPRRPAAIQRLVIAVHVISFYRQFLARLWSHVRKKVEPALANLDTAPSVVFVLRGRRIVASSFYVFPRSVFRGAVMP